MLRDMKRGRAAIRLSRKAGSGTSGLKPRGCGLTSWKPSTPPTEGEERTKDALTGHAFAHSDLRV